MTQADWNTLLDGVMPVLSALLTLAGIEIRLKIKSLSGKLPTAQPKRLADRIAGPEDLPRSPPGT